MRCRSQGSNIGKVVTADRTANGWLAQIALSNRLHAAVVRLPRMCVLPFDAETLVSKAAFQDD